MQLSSLSLSRRVFLASALVASCFFFSTSKSNADEPNFQQISDVVYKKIGDREIKLNLFLPVKDGQTLKGEPLLIYLDSGCWYSGEPGNGGLWRSIGALERGFAVASVSHRPINEAKFPAPMEDVRAAVRFLRKHAAEYGYDPERFAVAGYSSGGNLSLSLGISDERSIFNVGDNLDVSGQVQYVIDYYGPADLALVFERYSKQAIDCIYDAFGFDRKLVDKSNKEYYDKVQELAKKYSPITYVDENYAPTLIFQGTEDPLVPLSQSALMYEALRVAGVHTQLIVGDGGVHDPRTVTSLNMATREIFEFLRW